MATLGVAVALSLVTTPGIGGLPTYPYFSGGPFEEAIEGTVILTAIWTAIAFAVLLRRALLLILLGGVVAVAIWGALFVLFTFQECEVIGLDGLYVCVQVHPQTLLAGVWALAFLGGLIPAWILRSQAVGRASLSS